MKKKPENPNPSVLQILLGPGTPHEVRYDILVDLLQGDEALARLVVAKILDAAASQGAQAVYEVKRQELEELLKMMMEGPLRPAHFVAFVKAPPLGQRAKVALSDGSETYSAVPDKDLEKRLRTGDLVWLDAQARAVVFHEPVGDPLGEEAEIERWLDDGNLEVKLGEQGRHVFRAAADLLEQRERGEAEPGATLVVCARRRFAWRALPKADGLAHFRYLSREPVPDVVVARDIGNPAQFVGEFDAHLRRELQSPGLSKRYGMRRSQSRLLTGVPGTGKTFHIQGFWNQMYGTTAEVLGLPVEDLPPRVMQLRVPEVLSRWVGVADQNIARFFDEAEQLAGERHATPDGREVELPLLLIVEECDAWARERGEDGIHDRIQTTLLTYLDPSRGFFRDGLVFVLCTTNVPQLVDTAFARRVGGAVERFGRLDRQAFRSIVEKQLAPRPFRLSGAASAVEARAGAVDDLVTWLYAPNTSEPGVVEVTYAGEQDPVVFHRRDFLTAALVDRAVQQASAEACDAEWRGASDPGLSTGTLVAHVDRQVRAIADQLTAHNADRYLTLPDGARAVSVCRIPQPAALGLELERAS